MSWQLFRWTWQLDGPMFVGTSPAGALNRCRLYVPARAIWGAVTAELARLESKDYPRYPEVGDELRENARFSYLYPGEPLGKDWFAWLPEYRVCHGLVWVREDAKGNLADRRFRRRLLWTRPATAIDPKNDSALEGSLHETECVEACWRCEDGSAVRPVGMVGYVFLRKNTDLRDRLKELTTLFIGGDTRYGLGRVHRVVFEETDAFFGAEEVDLAKEQPHVSMQRTLAHTFSKDSMAMVGDREALGGWDGTGRLQNISRPIWIPGSRIPEGDKTLRFCIGKDGLWTTDGPNGGPSS